MTNKLFPPIQMNNAEMRQLAEAVNSPIIQKYLTHLASSAIREITTAQRTDGESAESFLERVALVKGGLSAIETLLDIEKPNSAA